MKTLQQQEQPANAAMPLGTAATPRPPALEDFTPPELDVAEILKWLSGSSTSMGGCGASAASGSSSPRSVNDAPSALEPAPAPLRELALPRGPGAGGDADEEEDEEEESGSQGRMRRYRPITEIYHATARFARFSLRNKKE